MDDDSFRIFQEVVPNEGVLYGADIASANLKNPAESIEFIEAVHHTLRLPTAPKPVRSGWWLIHLKNDQNTEIDAVWKTHIVFEEDGWLGALARLVGDFWRAYNEGGFVTEGIESGEDIELLGTNAEVNENNYIRIIGRYYFDFQEY